VVAILAGQHRSYLLKLLNFRIDLREDAFHFHTTSLTAVKNRLVLSNASQ
jgi:hypothetical protein